MAEFDAATQINGSPKLSANSVTDRMVEAAWKAYQDAQSVRRTFDWMRPVIEAALRERPAPEPVAWTDPDMLGILTVAERDALIRDQGGTDSYTVPLYAHPQQPDDECCTRATCRIGQRVPLTKEELHDLLVKTDPNTQRLPAGFVLFARAIEQAHGIGGEK